MVNWLGLLTRGLATLWLMKCRFIFACWRFMFAFWQTCWHFNIFSNNVNKKTSKKALFLATELDTD